MKNNIFRQQSYDWLRSISCISVVILHIASMYLKDDFSELVSHIDYMTASFWRVLTQLAVPSFVMLSGAFIIKSENEDFKLFYKKTFRRIILPTLAFSVMYVLLHYAENFISSILGISVDIETRGVWTPILNLIKGQPHVTMWYMYMIIPLYLVTPVIVMIKKSLSTKVYRKLAIIMMIYSVLVEKSCSLSWILQFVNWIGFFMLGDVIREWICELCQGKLRNKLQIGGVLIILSYFLLILHWYIFTYRSGQLTIPGIFSWIVIISTLIQFMGFSIISINKPNYFIGVTATYSLEIYLIHPVFCEICMQLFGRIIKYFPAAWMIPMYALINVFVCIGLVLFIKNILKINYYIH